MAEPRLMQFVSESKLQELKAARGATVEDGTLAADKPLHAILKENKDKQDKEFKERFKHRPPKALDDEEMEFLEKVEMSRRQQEQQKADEEAKALSSFHEAVMNKTITSPEQQKPSPAKVQTEFGPKRPSLQPGLLANVIIKAKKPQQQQEQPQKRLKTEAEGTKQPAEDPHGALAGLAAYVDESEEE